MWSTSGSGSRWWYAVTQGWSKRKRLKQILDEPRYQVRSLSEITGQKLDDAEIAVLILDFDGVLASHGAEQPSPMAEDWLRKITLEVGEFRIAVLSNQVFPARVRYFAKHFPLIHFVQGVRKKPYPDGILEVVHYKGVPPHRVVLLDDRLLTGMLATCLAFSQGWYFRYPEVNYWKRPLKELFFSFLRVVERCMFRLA